MAEQEKKPVYKKWWFWVIVVIVLLIIVGGTNSSTTNQTQTTLTEGTENSATESTTTNATNASKQYAVGEVYQDSSRAIKFVSVDENFTGYSQYADVKDGYKVVKAEFEGENLGSSDFYFSAYDFNCYADGYDCESFWSVDDSGFSSTLSTGKKAKGAVYFQVPTTAENITIEFDINTFTGDKIEFVVK